MPANRRRRPTHRRRTPEQLAARAAAVPTLTYPPELPVSEKRDEIIAALKDNQVIVVAGETGSGKTTQLPKIALEAGRGVNGQIGHTQPRRIAARTVAERIASELDVELGKEVGYAVRFTDKVSADSYVKVMTDGILLAEIQRDRILRRYDTIIIDEAHERSLNIDFILGYLKELLPKRPDLKVIITSATIDPEAFSRHFDGAPVISVSGRTYPVEVRYRPLVDPDRPDAPERDLVQGVLDACAELAGEDPGDVLVFLSGEREIRDVADALRELNLPNTEVLPLFARLSSAEQHRVFSPHRGRRIVLATNVAETSLTVPGIKYVVDAGTARISRYSLATKVQRLPIEPISQASAKQRAGRAGRTSAGIAIRLYSEDDYESRPEFTEPEITRTNLAAVILQMVSARLGDIERFPFIDPPDRRNIADGLALLHELGAIERGPELRLTNVGRAIAALPIDPRLARMIVEGDRRGAVLPVMVVAAALSIQDPRERPVDQEAAADQQHARFTDKTSDFLSILNLWRYLREKQKELSGNQFRKMCQREFINYVRVREWQDLVAQLRQIAATVGIHARGHEISDDDLHQSVLAGLLSHIGMQDAANKREYLGARGARFAIFPGSALFKKNPPFVVAAELVDTSRLWGRTVARIDPAWAEHLGAHLVKRSYSEPHWSRKRAAVVAREKVTLYGVPIVTDRQVNYARIDPELSRELFIRQALVERDWDSRHAFLAHNDDVIAEVERLEDKSRRRDLVIDDETLFSFYDSKIPADVVSGRHFDKWWKHERHSNPALLDLTVSDVLRSGAAVPGAEEFPDVWRDGDRPLELTYRFDDNALAATSEAESTDGISVDIPLVTLQQTDSTDFEWLVPGRLEELLVALIKSLPKALRRHVVPAPDRARALLPVLDRDRGSLLMQVANELRRTTGAAIRESDFDWSKVPAHLRMTFRVVDEKGAVVGSGKDLEALKDQLGARQRAQVAQVSRSLERSGITDWDVDELPRTVRLDTAHGPVDGYPTLRWEGTAARLEVATSPALQAESLRTSVGHLVSRALPNAASQVTRSLSAADKMALSQAPYSSPGALFDDCQRAVVLDVVDQAGLPFNRAEFDALLPAARAAQVGGVLEAMERAARVVRARLEVDAAMPRVAGDPVARADIETQLAELMPENFVSRHGVRRLSDIERYLKAIAVRLERLATHRDRDRVAMADVHAVRQDYDDLTAEFPAGDPPPPAVVAIRWMIEELRIGLFAPSMRPAYSISVPRIHKAMDRI